jgi:DNA processing protein
MSELACAAFAAATGSHLVSAPRTARFETFRASFDEPAYLAELAHRGFRWLARSDPAFPALLRAIHDPPPGLFVRGTADVSLLAEVGIAVVGARACSLYGSSVATSMSQELAAAGVVVVSGLARGVDAAAHRGALESGRTVAVLGCGIDRDYPRSHAGLAARIAERGLIVSEYPPGVEPAPWRFPARNRIVAGISRATLVIEARERSGALITADLALEEGRDVLAVPGEITSALSAGTNALLRLGATPATRVEDVFEVLGIEPPVPTLDVSELDAVERAVLVALAAEAGGVDELVARTGLTAATVAGALAALELDGRVVAADGIFRNSALFSDQGVVASEPPT